jgi:hypothetical protein
MTGILIRPHGFSIVPRKGRRLNNPRAEASSACEERIRGWLFPYFPFSFYMCDFTFNNIKRENKEKNVR